MKKSILVALLAIFGLVSFDAKAQYQQGDLLLNGGVSVGLIGYGFGYGGAGAGMPALTANLEYSLDDRFAVGPYLGYFGRSYKSGPFRDRLSVFGFGARGAFHASSSLNEWFDLSIDEESWDFYGTLVLGYQTFSWSYDDDRGTLYAENNTAGGLVFGPALGLRYRFQPALGAFMELGRGSFGWLTLGVSGSF